MSYSRLCLGKSAGAVAHSGRVLVSASGITGNTNLLYVKLLQNASVFVTIFDILRCELLGEEMHGRLSDFCERNEYENSETDSYQ